MNKNNNKHIILEVTTSNHIYGTNNENEPKTYKKIIIPSINHYFGIYETNIKDDEVNIKYFIKQGCFRKLCCF